MANQRILLRALKCLALLLVLSLGPLCFGESVVVQILNGGNGQPIAGQLVTIRFHYAKTAGAEEHTMVMNQITDPNGAVQFQMPLVLPDTLEAEVDVTSRFLHCSRRVLSKTETVIREGLTVAPRTFGSKCPFAVSAPGHIVFVARPSRFLEKALFDY